MKRATERLAFDANALIYFLDGVEPYAGWLAAVLKRVRDGRAEAVVSVIVEAEMMVRPLRLADVGALRALEVFLRADHVHLIDVTRAIAEEAARIRASTNLKLPDSLIIATATLTECDALFGNDRDCYKQAAEVRYVYLNEAVAAGPYNPPS